MTSPDLSRSTAFMLRAGIVVGILLMVAGLVQYAYDGGEALLYLGILILIISPFLGVIVSFVVLILEKDWRWALVAAVLVIVTTVGILLSLE